MSAARTPSWSEVNVDELYPAELRFKSAENKLEIDWEDGHASLLPGHVLRNGCPCALCTDQRIKSGPKSVAGSEGTISDVEVVGNYAISVSFQDGHATGIYIFEHLRKLCACPACMAV